MSLPEGSGDILGGGFKYFLCSPRKLGKILSLTNIFQRGWFNHQPVFFPLPPKKISCFMDPSSEFIFGSSSPAPATVLDVPDGRWDGIGSRLMNEAKCTKIMLHLQHHLGGGFKHFLFPSLPEEDSHLA